MQISPAPHDPALSPATKIGWRFSADWCAQIGPFTAYDTPAGQALPSGSDLGGGIKIFHNGHETAVQAKTLMPDSITLQTMQFTGTYLALAIDLPGPAIAGLRKDHILRLAAHLNTQNCNALHARLNLSQLTKTQEMQGSILGQADQIFADFDFYHTEMGQTPAKHGWIDLIFSPQSDCLLTLGEITVGRRPRANF